MSNKWQTKPLVDVCEIFADGDWIESKDQSPEGIRLIQTGNIGEGKFKSRGEKARYISEITFKRLRCTEIFDGDCLISRLPEPVGRSCLLPITCERMITAVDCTILRFNQNQILPKFFNYYSQSNNYLSAVESNTSGTTRKRISRNKLAQIPITFPSICEQKRIVDTLEEAFKAIDKAKANTEKNLKNARELFEQNLNERFSKLGDRWETKKLGELFAFKNGRAFKKEEWCSKGLPIIRIQNLNNENGTFNYFSGKYDDNIVVQDNDLLFSWSGTVGSSFGPHIWQAGKGLLNQHIFLVSFKIEIDRQYAYYALEKITKEIEQEVNGAVGLVHITKDKLNNFTIPVPSLSEQKCTVKEIQILFTETRRLETIYQRKLNALDELKKSLLHQAFTGNL